MKKLVTICAVTCLMLSSPVFAAAVYYVPDSITDAWTELYDDGTNTDVTDTITDPTPDGIQTEFVGKTSNTSGWWNIGIGHEYIWNVDNLDLTGYDAVSIEIHNYNHVAGDYVWARLFLNAGWVPNPGDTRLEGNAAWIEPDPEAPLISTINLSGLTATQKSQITKIGIDVGMYADDQYWDGREWYGQDFNVAVTVPEPATICLLGLSSLTLLRKRRS